MVVAWDEGKTFENKNRPKGRQVHLAIDVFAVADIEEVDFLRVYPAEFDAIIAGNPEAPNFLVNAVQVFSFAKTDEKDFGGRLESLFQPFS